MKFPDITRLYSLFREFPQVITDTRKAASNSVFFALKGENFNGNEFAMAALDQGCAYAVVDEEKYYGGDKYILVKNCLETLQQLSKHHRQHLKIPFIAITGSNGKTTTKELIKSVLSKKYKVLATTGNLNNHIGVPLTLLSIASDIEIAIIEMGANHTGEIAMLCEIANPDYGLITNIGRAHIGEFGSFENILKAKTEMYDFIRRKNGKVFVNADNDLLVKHSSGIEKVPYGTPMAIGDENNFSQCQFIDSNPRLKVRYEDEIIASSLVGKYNFENVSAAICVGKYFGISAKQMKEAIEEYIPSNNRSQIVQTQKNTLILDAYNANPSSMSAAIENFSDLPPEAFAQGGMKDENKWLLLGDMLELGEYEINEHQNILKLIEKKKFQNVILVGKIFSKAVKEMKIAFFPLLFPDAEALSERVRSNSPIQNRSVILIKGSRGIRLEKVVEFL